MPKKISRNIALIKYRNLPLKEYDKRIDDEIVYYPPFQRFYWIKLEKVTKRLLVSEFKKLVLNLNFKELIILGQINKPWISKYTRNRKDFKPLIKTIKYFTSLKIGKKFNGAIKIDTNEIDDFISNFYVITKCDSAFYDYYITDIDENVLFHIHYSGEIKILILNIETQAKFNTAISKTKFIDALREGTDNL